MFAFGLFWAMEQVIRCAGLELRRKIFQQKVTVIKINEISQEMCGLRSKENQEMTQKALFYAE